MRLWINADAQSAPVEFSPLGEVNGRIAGDFVVVEIHKDRRRIKSLLEGLEQAGAIVALRCDEVYLHQAFDLALEHQVFAIFAGAAGRQQLRALCSRSERELLAWRLRYASDIIGFSSGISRALRVVQCAVDFDCPILVRGETGTGKDLVSQTVHRASRRQAAPLVAVNCPAIPKDLVESELFGHIKGAFTGATSTRVGKLAAADGGTVFLDEIGEMPLDAQAKLLRVLQDYRVTPVGSVDTHQVDFRLVAATNRDLAEMGRAGTFREDLYYRLNVICVELPSLREDPGTIATLLAHYLRSLSERRHVVAPRVPKGVFDRLVGYRWPGNVRELRNLVERLVILKRGANVTLDDLPAELVGSSRPVPALAGRQSCSICGKLESLMLRDALSCVEQELVTNALSQTRGNRQAAAQILGINRTTLHEKLRRMRTAASAV